MRLFLSQKTDYLWTTDSKYLFLIDEWNEGELGNINNYKSFNLLLELT